MSGLRIPRDLLIIASGLEPRVVKKDIQEGLLHVDDKGQIWYRDAIQYVNAKWAEGKEEMYEPFSDNEDHNFPARVLSLLDDQVSVGNLKIVWERSFR